MMIVMLVMMMIKMLVMMMMVNIMVMMLVMMTVKMTIMGIFKAEQAATQKLGHNLKSQVQFTTPGLQREVGIGRSNVKQTFLNNHVNCNGQW